MLRDSEAVLPVKKNLAPYLIFLSANAKDSQAGVRVPWDWVVEARRVWVEFA
jgi:hypothetical protein